MLFVLIGLGALSSLGYLLYQYGVLGAALEIIGEVIGSIDLSDFDFSLD